MANSAANADAPLSAELPPLHRDGDARRRQHEALWALRERGELVDVTLVLDGAVEVAAHRVVLAAGCPFFRALFTCGMAESRARIVPLPELDPPAFAALLRFLYVGELQLTPENVLPVLFAANRLELDGVVEFCCTQLMLALSVHNCADVYLGCAPLTREPCRLLAHAAKAMLDTFFADVRRTPSFRNLPLDAALTLSPQASNTPTDIVSNNTSASVPLPASGMVNSKASEVNSAIVKDQPLTPTIFAIGGFSGPCALKSVEFLDFHAGKWLAAPDMAERRSYAGVAVAGARHIFVLGGTCSARHLTSVERFDPETNAWTAVPPMSRARSYLGAAAIGDFLYAVGGFNGLSHLHSVERFSLKTQTWEEVAPLATGRSGLAVTVLDGLLYAIGGYDGQRHLSSVEVYDPQTDTWRAGPAMCSARNGPAAIAQPRRHRILVFGGESRHGVRMNSSEVLEVQAGEWRERDGFLDCRSGHAALSFLDESFLFCLGGSNKKDEYLATVHRYDFLSKTWRRHSRMLAQRCGLNVAVALTSPGAACFDAHRKETAKRPASPLEAIATAPLPDSETDG